MSLLTELNASSAPVPLNDMIHGWQGAYQDGEYAWGNLQQTLLWQPTSDNAYKAGRSPDWQIGWRKRWHYDLEFSEGMSRYYRAAEQGQPLQQDESLSLAARSVEAQGVLVGRRLELSRYWQLTPVLTLYRAQNWQFGELSGRAWAGDTDAASATLDYQFSEDKLLEYPVRSPSGYGASLDLQVDWQPSPNWQTRLKVADLWNRWRLAPSGTTSACINLNQPSETVCVSRATASGRSDNESVIASLRSSWTAELTHLPLAMTTTLFSAGRYRYAKLAWQPSVSDDWWAKVGVSTLRQWELGIGSRWLAVSAALDDARLGQARDMNLNLNLSFMY